MGDLTVGLVLHLHRLLFSFADGHGGTFKIEDNLVGDRQGDGTTTTRFVPVSAHETPFYIEELTRTGPADVDARAPRLARESESARSPGTARALGTFARRLGR